MSAAAPTAPEPTRACAGCGNGCKADARFCPKCGTSFEPPVAAPLESPQPVAAMPEPTAPASIPAAATEACPHCAAPVKAGARFCGKCGKTIERASAISAAESALAPAAQAPAAEAAKPVPPATPIPAKPDPLPPAPATTLARSTKPLPVVAIGVAVVALAVIAGGAFFALRKPASDVAVTAAAATAAVQPAEVPAAPAALKPAAAPTARPAPIAEPRPEPAAAVVAQEPPAPPPAPARKPLAQVVPKPAAQRSPPPVAQRDDSAMDAAVAAALDDGAQCFNQKKFDCAIANANTVLRFSPGNRQAQDMKRRAKEAQDKALSSIQIQ